MTFIKALVGSFLLLLVAISPATATKAVRHQAVLSHFQFIQKGKVVRPENGMVTLERKPFLIRYDGEAGKPSLWASALQEGATVDISGSDRLREPLASFTGNSLASAKRNLYLDDEPLKVRDSWFAFKLDRDDTHKNGARHYRRLAKLIGEPPGLLLSGRDYASFQKEANGSYSFLVEKLADVPIADSDQQKFKLVFFLDGAKEKNINRLYWGALGLRFL